VIITIMLVKTMMPIMIMLVTMVIITMVITMEGGKGEGKLGSRSL
jgi:hypothetical protein